MSMTNSSPESGHQFGHPRRRRACAQQTTRTGSTGIERNRSENDLESLLSSVIIASDKELRNITREIDEAAGVPRRNNGSEKLGERVFPVVWSALKHLILERELRNLALTDDLTCLYNRRGFFAAATQQLKVARRNMRAALLFFCDVDNLKHIYHLFGHDEGNLALVRTADVLEQTFRDSDILARLGEDEFAALALGTSAVHADAIAGRLKTILDKANESEPRYRISVTIGRAPFDPHHPADLSELIFRADRSVRAATRRRVSPPGFESIRDQHSHSPGESQPDADEW